MGTNFERPAPKKLRGQKKSSKIMRDFWQLSTLIANISGADQHIKNRKTSWKSTTTPTLDEKKFVYFGPQTTEYIPLITLHPNGFFSGDYISALRGCCALNFLHVQEIHKGLLAHTPSGAGVSPKSFNRENLKFALKFSLLESITSGLVALSSRNFFSRRAARQGW